MDAVLSVRRENHDTVTLRLPFAKPFLPGQYVMLGVEADGVELKRSYSVANVFNGEWIELTIRRQDPGLVSKLVQHWSGGEEVRIYGPFGKRFVFDPQSADPTTPVILLAAGSGITPFRSFAQAVQKTGYIGTIDLVYSVRAPHDVIYSEELFTWPVKSTITLTQPGKDIGAWGGRLGRISMPLIREIAGASLARAHYYVCGPTAFVVDMAGMLRRMGVDPAQIRTEKFGLVEA